MHILLSVAAGVLLSHDLNSNVFALTVRDDDGVQAILSESNSPIALPDGVWNEVDISEGWADPRINGGRLLDVSRPSVIRTTRC
jgi:hypothetical protein